MLQYIVAGLALGGVYALISAALVFTYSSTGVLNFAFGAIAFTVARVYNDLVVAQGWSHLPAALLSIVVLGPLLGVFLWALLFRVIHDHSPLIKVVATIGLAVALPAAADLVLGTDQILTTPGLAPSPVHVFDVAGVPVDLDKVITFACVIALGLLSFLVLRFTTFGLKIRGFVDSKAMTSLAGTNQQLLAMSVWAVGTTVAGLAGVLVAPVVGLTGPSSYTLLLASAFAAALVARLKYAGRAAAAGVLLGVATVLAQRYLPSDSTWTTGLVNSIPFAFIVVSLLVYAVADQLPEETEVGGPVDRAIAPVGAGVALTPGRANSSSTPWWRTGSSWTGLVIMVVIGSLPLLLSGSWVGLVGLGLAFGVAFLGFTLVTGEGGMIWLCLISFAGMGAVFTAQFATVHGLPSLLALVLGAATAVPLGLLIGMLALRMGDLYLALITLTVGLLLDNLIFARDRFTNFGAGVPLARPSFAESDRAFAYFVLAVFCLVALLVWNIRRSTTGLALAAVRTSGPGAAAIGISTFRMKVFIAGLGSFVAGLGGGLIAMYGTAAIPGSFNTLTGIVWLAVLVTTGVRSNVAAAVAGLAYALMPAIFAKYLVPGLGPLPMALFGLGAIMVAHDPDGALAQNGRALRALFAKLVGGGRGADGTDVEPTATIRPEEVAADGGPAAAGAVAGRRVPDGEYVLSARDVTVRFGGVTALSSVSLEIFGGEVVGLVGPNGAGKSTLFGVMSGLIRAQEGTVTLLGEDVSVVRPEGRARRGLARTFQQPELFLTLTVRDHLVLADRLRHSRARLFRDSVTPVGAQYASPGEDERVDRLLDVLGLDAVSHRLAAGLPTGITRLVEIGRALACEPWVVLLDEPTAGLDPEESHRLGEALRDIADTSGTSLLLVEHDLDLVLAVSNRVYVLDFGVMIASGVPDDVRNDPLVRSAYMGVETLTEESV